MMEVLLIVFFVSAIVYALFIIWCTTGWSKIKIFEPGGDYTTFVSIIIPARNEEAAIGNCLKDLFNQNYPKDLFEIILADDDSKDNTVAVAESERKKFPDHQFKITRMHEDDAHSLFKKKAITSAIEIAKRELIITTDADCRMGNKWLSTVVSYFEKYSPQMISAPVCFRNGGSLFEKIQSLELMGLIGIGAAGISNGNPVMCNGANLAYTKNIFKEVNGFADEINSASGDDTQLMLKIAKRDKRSIHFLKSPEAIVYSSPKDSLGELYHQRKRWASKIPAKMSAFTVLIALVAYLLHLGLGATFVASFFSPSFFLVFLSVFLFKCLTEFLFLYSLASFFQREKLLWLFLPAQFFYMFYIVIIGAVAPFGSYRWKGRKVK